MCITWRLRRRLHPFVEPSNWTIRSSGEKAARGLYTNLPSQLFRPTEPTTSTEKSNASAQRSNEAISRTRSLPRAAAAKVARKVRLMIRDGSAEAPGIDYKLLCNLGPSFSRLICLARALRSLYSHAVFSRAGWIEIAAARKERK